MSDTYVCIIFVFAHSRCACERRSNKWRPMEQGSDESGEKSEVVVHLRPAAKYSRSRAKKKVLHNEGDLNERQDSRVRLREDEGRSRPREGADGQREVAVAGARIEEGLKEKEEEMTSLSCWCFTLSAASVVHPHRVTWAWADG
jgi:hypothetical protein